MNNELNKAAELFAKRVLIFTADFVGYNKEMHASFIAGAEWNAQQNVISDEKVALEEFRKEYTDIGFKEEKSFLLGFRKANTLHGNSGVSFTAEQIEKAAIDECEQWKSESDKKRTDWDYKMLGFANAIIDRLKGVYNN